MLSTMSVFQLFIIIALFVTGTISHRNPGQRVISVPASPAVVGNGPVINPVLCVGVTAFMVGTAIGIGIGVLITNNRYRNGFGGGIWFGKRKKRSAKSSEAKELSEISGKVLDSLHKAEQIYAA